MSDTPTTPDLFAYLDYRAFLRDWFEARKAIDPAMSHRSFVRAAGMKSSSVVLNVIEGRRNLSAESVDGFATALELDHDAREFFRALVTLDQATTDDERNDALAIISAERRFRMARHLEGEAFDFLSYWYLPAIHQLAARPDFSEDPTWIASQLRPAITADQAARAVTTLVALGLLVRADGGRLVSADESIVTAREIAHLAACNYHRQMTLRAYDSVAAIPPDERHLLGVTIAVPRGRIAELKAELNRMQARLLDLADGMDEPADAVYQINLQLVPLSHIREEPS